MTDRRIFLTVVLTLGVTLVACVVAITVLAGLGKTTPGILENLAVGSLTGLAGLLAKGPHDETPQNVNVVNPPGDPVPVDAGAGELRLILLFAAGIVLGLAVYYSLIASHVS